MYIVTGQLAAALFKTQSPHAATEPKAKLTDHHMCIPAAAAGASLTIRHFCF